MFYGGLYLVQKTGVNTARTLYNHLTLVEAEKLREFTDILARTEIRFTHTGTIAVPVLVEVVQFGAVHLQEYPNIT